MNSFAEVRFENGIVTLGMQGGAEFSTMVVSVNSGFEQRNQNWTQARASFQLGNRTVTPQEFQTLNAFFHARRGRLQGFRLKNWMDYKDDGAGRLGAVNQTGEPFAGESIAGASVYQMFKVYESGDDAYFEKIPKPVNDGSLKVYADGSPLTLGIGPGQYVPDFTSGKISIGATTKAVTAATNAGSAALTVAGHGLATGNKVTLAGFGDGWASANGQSFTVEALDANTLRIALNSSAFGAFTSGNVRWWLQAGVELTWTGEFDYAVRFDTDKFDAKVNTVIHGPEGISSRSLTYVDIGNVPVVQVRI